MVRKRITITVIICLIAVIAAAVPTGKAFATSKIKISKCSVTLSKTSYTYNGSARKPSVTVKYKGKKLSSDYYYVKYKNYKKPGRARVTVYGKNGYTGSTSRYYNIKMGKVKDLKAVYKGMDPESDSYITVTWTAAVKCSYYQIVASKDGKAFGTFTTTDTKYTITDLGDKGTFKISVCSMDKGGCHKSGYWSVSVLAGLFEQPIEGDDSFSRHIGEDGFDLDASAVNSLSYKSNDTGVVTVDKTGHVTIKAPGKTTIRITAARGGNYIEGTKDVSIKIEDLDTPSIDVSSSGYRRMDVSWDEITGAQSYQIKDGSDEVTSVDSGDTTSTSFYDKTKGTSYSYKVRACTTVNDKKYYSSWSSSDSASAKGTYVGEAAMGDKGTSGNKAGDQSGSEVRIRAWKYSSTKSSYKHITHVARFNDPEKAEIAASLVEAACKNNYIGYDQPNRKTLLNYCKNNYKWKIDSTIVANITTKLDCSCVTLVEFGVNGAYGKKLVSGFNASETMTKKIKALPEVFTLYTDSKHTASDAYLQRGDIIYSETGGHACMVL